MFDRPKNVDVIRTSNLMPYPKSLIYMQESVHEVYQNEKLGKLWLLEHDHLYTYGSSGSPDDLLDPSLAPVFLSGRGGKYTYHGPGQRIVYAMLNIKRLPSHTSKPDIRLLVTQLEDWIILTLKDLDIKAHRVSGRVGIWIKTADAEQKIASIGIRIRKWVSFHGIAININPDLTYFRGIVPCGLTDVGVCSLQSLGINISLKEFDVLLLKNFYTIFHTNLNEIIDVKDI